MLIFCTKYCKISTIIPKRDLIYCYVDTIEPTNTYVYVLYTVISATKD